MKVVFRSNNFFNKLSCFIFKNRRMANLPKIYVRNADDEDTMKISFTYGNSCFSERDFTFLRSKSEKLEVSLFRLRFKIQNFMAGKSAKKKGKQSRLDQKEEETPPIKVHLIKNGQVLSTDVKNIEAWTPGTQVQIGESIYEIASNAPNVVSISLPKIIMAGFPVYPKLTVEYCLKEDCQFTWYRSLTKDDRTSILNSEENLKVVKVSKNYWLKVGEGFIYITSENDVDHYLRLTCLPKSSEEIGKEVEITSKLVQPCPGKCPFENRHLYTQKFTETGSIRCISYNILANLYADTDTARNELFAYCDKEALTLDYRKQLYLKEILGYKGDIICLQEVDKRVFFDDLVPVLSSANLEGIFNEKGGQVAEGLACFYRPSKFKLVDSQAIVLSEIIKEEPAMQNIYSQLLKNEKLGERFLNRTTLLQIVLLECLDASKKRILIGNTHLYFHPDSDNIRLMQAACCIQYLEKVLKEYVNKDPSYSISLVFSGDFNSCPQFGVFKLMTEGFLQQECDDWKSNSEEMVPGISLSHNFSLESAYGTPEFTNYTLGFIGCLDYIFFDKTLLTLEEIVPLPPIEDVKKHSAIPSILFPSDHLALICTLKWK